MDDVIEGLKLQLMGYFGDRDDEEALDELREDVKHFPETARIFREGIETALLDPGVDCVSIVEGGANRYMEGSQSRSREWLATLKAALFPG